MYIFAKIATSNRYEPIILKYNGSTLKTLKVKLIKLNPGSAYGEEYWLEIGRLVMSWFLFDEL